MIIPALDILNGKSVRLFQGNYNLQSIYGDPISILQQYIKEGAKIVHIVDLNGARNPAHRQISLIKKIIQKTSSALKIQIGGGIRNIEDIEVLLKLGAYRIVLGSSAITHPETVQKWFLHFDPNILVLAIDIQTCSQKNHKIMIHGWKKETNMQLDQIIKKYQSSKLKHVLCTDIIRDGTLTGSNLNLYQSLCQNWPHLSFQASGGVLKLTEISKLRHCGVKSVIVGRAFLEKNFTVSEAIKCWQNV